MRKRRNLLGVFQKGRGGDGATGVSQGDSSAGSSSAAGSNTTIAQSRA